MDKIEINDGNWFKDGFLWLDPSEPWDIELYGYRTDNKFDLISNTMKKIVIDNDTSEWAKEALVQCSDLLKARLRWPTRLDHKYDPKSKFEMWLGGFLYKTGVMGMPKTYGSVKRMSRDPFINFYTACTHLNRYDLIRNVVTPWYLYRPNTWLWRRFLLTGKGLGLYRFFNWFSGTNKPYLKRLVAMREIAIKNYEVQKDS